MTITPYEQDQPATTIERYQTAAVHRLAEWAQSAQAAHTVAQSLVKTSFVPASFQRKPEEATAAILAGMEVGLSPMAALRSFDVIQGQAAPRAITLRAIVQSFGHQIEVVESTASRCTMRGRRRDGQQWQTVQWTIERAREMSLLGKENWKKQPQAMLVARATSELARLIAADAILGIGYTTEELADGADPETTPVASPEPLPAQVETRVMSRKPRQAKAEVVEAQPEPVNDDPEPSGLDEFAESEKIRPAQMRLMQKLFGDKGFASSDDRHQFVEQVCDITVESSKDLSVDQASRVIDALQSIDDPQPEDAA